MGQSVNSTGFRLRNLKNWGCRSVCPEKERYAPVFLKDQKISLYLSGFFTRLVERRIKTVFKKEKSRMRIFRWKVKKRMRRNLLRWMGKHWRKKKKYFPYPRIPFHWMYKCRYKEPVFFYSHSVSFLKTEKREIHVILYMNIKYKRVFRENWKKVNTSFFPMNPKTFVSFAKSYRRSLVKHYEFRKKKEETEKRRTRVRSQFGPFAEKNRLWRAESVKRGLTFLKSEIRDLKLKGKKMKPKLNSLAKQVIKKRRSFFNLCAPSSLEYLGCFFSKKGYYRTFLEKQVKVCFQSILEARLARSFFSVKEPFSIKVHFLKSPWLNSSLCARYLIYLLRRRKGYFPKIAGNLLTRTPFFGGEKHNLYGIFISGAGRFTKRQRASYMKSQKGRIPFSTPTAAVEYIQLSVPLKYGACSVRVWICHLRKMGIK